MQHHRNSGPGHSQERQRGERGRLVDQYEVYVNLAERGKHRTAEAVGRPLLLDLLHRLFAELREGGPE